MKEIAPPPPPAPPVEAAPAKQDNVKPDAEKIEKIEKVEDAPPPPPPVAETPVPVFRPRTGPDFRPRPSTPMIPTVIPLVRAPDDPGVSDGTEEDEFSDRTDRATAQAGGFRGFWSRLVRSSARPASSKRK